MTHHFVTTQWLADHLHDDNLRIIDIRGHVLPASEPPPHYFSHRADYEAAHIPGAVFVDWTTDIINTGAAPDTAAYYNVAPTDDYVALMSRLGVGDETFVVAYDDAGGMFAARLWWTLLYYGHAQAAVLDGGWQKWLAENHPTTAEIPRITPAIFTPRLMPDVLAESGLIADGVSQLIDVRSLAEYNGESSRAKRKGHIPGAINLPRKQLLADDGTLLPIADLRQHLHTAGIDLDQPDTVVYCNAGVSASYVLLALRAAGLTGGRVYDGSWKDWGNDESKPIA